MHTLFRRVLAAGFLLMVGAAVCAAQQKPPDKRDSTVVIPAGTKITVQLNYDRLNERGDVAGKVAWPVQNGFTTLIPAGSKVQARVITQYVDDHSRRRPTWTTVQTIQLISLTIGDRTYAVETDELELQVGTVETKFTLVADLEIKR